MDNILEKIISLETSILAQELGFISLSKTVLNYEWDLENNKAIDLDWVFEKDISKYKDLPVLTHTQLQTWLRETKRISVNVKHYTSGTFSYDILVFNNDASGWKKASAFIEKSFYKHEEAFEKALYEGLKILEKNIKTEQCAS